MALPYLLLSEPDADPALTRDAEALVTHCGALYTVVDTDIALRPPLEPDICNTAEGVALARRGEGEVLRQQHRIDGVVAEPLQPDPETSTLVFSVPPNATGLTLANSNYGDGAFNLAEAARVESL